MSNFSKAISSMFHKTMGDKTPIVPNEESSDQAPSSTSSSAIEASSRIVHFPRISESEPTPTSHVNHHGGFAYEELMQGSVPCPSCDGSGRIPREREKQLVALIPLTDKRLKPRRTTLYVSAAVLASVIVCSLCMFFLIPRSITLSSTGFEIVPYYSYVNETETTIKLSFVNAVNITNSNYVPLTIVNATMTTVDLLDSKRMISQSTNLTQWSVPLRGAGVVAFNTSIVFNTELMIDYCKLVKIMYLQFDIMVTCRYMGHEEQSSLSINQQLFCYSK